MKSIRYIAIGLLLAATVLLIWEKISFRSGNKGVQQKRINGITTNADIKTADGVIGYDRIIEMLQVVDGNLVVEEKAIYSIEKFLVS